jgi:hypothetical protein
MTKSPTSFRRNARLGVTALVATATLAVPGVVSAAAPSSVTSTTAVQAAPATAGDDLRPRLELACLRIPNLTIRTEHLLERLQADADTFGSLAWLEAQIARAEASGREQLVTVLQNRLAVRQAYVPVLEQRLERLPQLAERCRELGVDI